MRSSLTYSWYDCFSTSPSFLWLHLFLAVQSCESLVFVSEVLIAQLFLLFLPRWISFKCHFTNFPFQTDMVDERKNPTNHTNIILSIFEICKNFRWKIMVYHSHLLDDCGTIQISYLFSNITPFLSILLMS